MRAPTGENSLAASPPNLVQPKQTKLRPVRENDAGLFLCLGEEEKINLSPFLCPLFCVQEKESKNFDVQLCVFFWIPMVQEQL
tara:strand:+ start:46 stop:294 length:249 start_codon:yes stop_codon:yes gene_type:complete